MQPLPVRAQFSAVYAILVKDLDGNGSPDIFLAGNFYGLKPETGRYDASYGVTFTTNAQHQFTYLAPAESGLFVRGEVRDIKQLSSGHDQYIIVSRNNDSLMIFGPAGKIPLVNGKK